MALRSRNAVLLIKQETTPGTEVTPSASTDAILVENPVLTFNPNIIQTDEVTGSLDAAGSVVSGMNATLTFSAYIKGSGAAGTAPEIGTILKACGWAETVTSTAVPSSAEACGSGASQTAVTLGTSAGTTDDQYNGMPITLTGTGAGSSFIADYAGSSKVATLTDTMGAALSTGTNYQIPVNVLYAPASASIPADTCWLYMDGLVYKMVGGRGTFSGSMDAGGLGQWSFTINFLLGDTPKADAAVPIPTTDVTRPPPFKGGVMKYDRVASAIANLSLDWGNSLTYPPNPNAQEGFDVPEIVRRRMTGSIDPSETLVADRDIFSDFRSGTRKIIHARYGGTAGNRIGITVPSALITGYQPGDRDGIATTGVSFDCVGPDGGAYLCFY